ncbi:hypothetical protein [Methanosarcina horonobensis]|uniref:hypothetical protein n=1 Tax=Methanosarcina horonobensis TaxID=418008 RepID=UPI000B090A25|nr:hypothetical protein [Methanosarcina horonobensis]
MNSFFEEDDDILPPEPDLSQYIDASIFEQHCKACRHRIIERQQARKHKPQTFKRGK